MQKLPPLFVWAGVCLFGSVILGWIVGPYVVNYQIANYMRLENGTFQWNKWANPEAKMYLKVYVFNVTNPEEVEHGGIPVFQELGPFTYREERHKIDIEYNEENDTLKYQEPIWFHFIEDMSNGRLDDTVTVINIPLIGVSHRLSTFASWIRYLLGTYLAQYDEPLFLKRTIKEVLFDGYYSPMVQELQDITGELYFENAMVGFLVGRNGTTQETIEVYAGNKDSSKFGGIASWNEKSFQTAWKDEPCRDIDGASEGTIIPPFQTKSSVILGYHRDVCRTFKIYFTNEIEYDGVPGYRYEPTEEQYYSGENNPENSCYCYDSPTSQMRDVCFEDGVIPGGACHKGAPVTISNPHFLYAPYYLNLTKGLSPNKEAHGLYAEIEPKTGLLLKAVRRMQMNMDVVPNGALKALRNVRSLQFPVVWVEESGFIDKDFQNILQYQLLLAQDILNAGRWIGVGASVALLISALSVNFLRSRKKPHIYN